MRIEQLLHGYQDGHGRLAGSLFNLSSKDSARLSMMSDWSGFKDPIGKDHSYITTYFLEDSGLYVVAKSWYAQEMERPGCVWTHSLLIDIESLPHPFDFRMLLPLFIRPNKGNYGVYNKPIELKEEEMKPIMWVGRKPDNVSLMFMLSTLLAGEERFYMKVELEPWWYQQLCLTMLQFLPVGILKRVSLSSGGALPRKLDGDMLSMQFVGNTDAISLLAPPWAGKLQEKDFNVGLSVAVRAMLGAGNDVSTLIRVFANDIGNEGKKYIAICQLIGALYLAVNKKEVSYQDVLGIIVSNFTDKEEGRLVKDNFLGKRIVSLYCSESEFLFLISTYDDIEDCVDAKRIGLEERVIEIVNSSKGGYNQLVNKILDSNLINAFGQWILSNSYHYLGSIDIESLSDDHWKKLKSYWLSNKAYLITDKWLGLQGERFSDILWQFSKSDNDRYAYWAELLDAVLTNDAYVDDSLIDKFYQHVDDCAVRVLDHLNTNEQLLRYDNLHVRPFRDVDALVCWLGNQNKVTSLVETLIVNYVWPSDYRVSQSDPRVWHWMISNDNGAKTPAYYVFMYEIAWHWRCEEVFVFFKHCFHQVFNGLADEALSDRIWNRMYRYGGKVSLLQEWDRCLKLKTGIVDHLKDLGFPKSVLEHFTPDEKINKSLLEIYEKIR